MTVLKRLPRPLVAILAAFALFLGLQVSPAAATAPSSAPVVAQAAAIQAGSFRICNSADGFTRIVVKRTTDVNQYPYWSLAVLRATGECTEYMGPGGVRVDTDPDGPSHSYKIKPIGTGASGVYGDCHTNSDNANSDPPNPTGGDSWSVYYKNYDDGYCTH